MKAMFNAALVAGFLMCASFAHAQDNGMTTEAQIKKLQSLSPEEREVMLRNIQHNAEAIRDCVSKAGGQPALEELQALSNAHQQQVAAFCSAGQRRQAQAYAQDASQELLKDPRVGKLRRCSRIALQNMPQLSQVAETGGINPLKHVCD